MNRCSVARPKNNFPIIQADFASPTTPPIADCVASEIHSNTSGTSTSFLPWPSWTSGHTHTALNCRGTRWTQSSHRSVLPYFPFDQMGHHGLDSEGTYFCFKNFFKMALARYIFTCGDSSQVYMSSVNNQAETTNWLSKNVSHVVIDANQN